MLKVCVLQTDNRPLLDYLVKLREVNTRICDILVYEYLFINLYNKNHNFHSEIEKIPKEEH